MKCDMCQKDRQSVKQSKLTNRRLCGHCRIYEYQEFKADQHVDKLLSEAYQ